MMRPSEELRREPASEIVIHVCVTCRAAGGPDEPALRPGARLHRALADALAQEAPDATAPAIRLEAVECLSVCKRPCTVAVTSPGRWTYVYGDLDPDTGAATVLDGARRYGATPDGIVPWRERPQALRTGVVARIPPLHPGSHR